VLITALVTQPPTTAPVVASVQVHGSLELQTDCNTKVNQGLEKALQQTIANFADVAASRLAILSLKHNGACGSGGRALVNTDSAGNTTTADSAADSGNSSVTAVYNIEYTGNSSSRFSSRYAGKY
jgi:hypothetical protein